MLAVKSISQLDPFLSSEKSLSSDTQLNLTNNDVMSNDDNSQSGAKITSFLNIDDLSSLWQNDALIEISLKNTDNDMRKSYKFEFGKFVQLIALNLASLNSGIMGNFLTKENADIRYVRTGLSSLPANITDGIDSDIYTIDETLTTQYIFTNIQLLSSKPEDDEFNPKMTINGGTLDVINCLTADNASLNVTNLTATNSTVTNSTVENLTTTSLTATNNLSVNSNGLSVVNLTATGSIEVSGSGYISTPTLKTNKITNTTGASQNPIISLENNKMLVNSEKTFSLEGSLELVGGSAKIGFKNDKDDSNYLATIANAGGKVKINKLIAGNADWPSDWTDKDKTGLVADNINVTDITINDTVEAAGFKTVTDNFIVNNNTLLFTGSIAQLTAQAACWS